MDGPAEPMLKFAARNLWSRPLRTSLSLLGLTVAIAGMVGLFSVARGLDQTVSQTFGRIPGLAAVQPGAPIPLFSTLPADWREEIAAVPGVHVVLPEIWQRVNVINQKMIFSPPRLLNGTGIPQRLRLQSDLYRECLTGGRFFTPEDQGTNHCLVSDQIAEEFGVGVGGTLDVNGHRVRIIGTYRCDSLLLDVTILMDIAAVREMTRFDPKTVSSFYIEPKPGTDNDALVERIRDVFRDRTLPPWSPMSLRPLSGQENAAQQVLHLLYDIAGLWPQDGLSDAPGDGPSDGPGVNGTSAADGSRDEAPLQVPEGTSSDFRVRPDMPIEIRTAEDWGKRFDRYADDLDVFLGLLTAIGLIIAVLSIINTMVMSVSERIIEFGILKANGWSKGDVLKLITCESGLIGLSGGLIGSAVGWAGVQLVNWNWPTRVELYASPGLLLFGVAFATTLGVLGGLYPALWAMRLMPMDAIRRG
jgi:putative ABC transport system permease protein